MDAEKEEETSWPETLIDYYSNAIQTQFKNHIIMQQKDDLRGLAKVMDFMRAVSKNLFAKT